MSVRDNFFRHGFLVIKGVISPGECDRMRQLLRNEWNRRIQEGESVEDVNQAKNRLHDMASFEYSEALNELASRLVDFASNVFSVRWLEDNRQIVYRTESSAKYACSLHRDGSHSAIEPGYAFPGFQVLAGVYLDDVYTAGSGGIEVIPGSHHLAVEEYTAGRDHEEGIANILRLEESEKSLGQAQLLKGGAGSVILCHSLTAHRPGMLRDTSASDIKVYARLRDEEDRMHVSKRVLKKVTSF